MRSSYTLCSYRLSALVSFAAHTRYHSIIGFCKVAPPLTNVDQTLLYGLHAKQKSGATVAPPYLTKTRSVVAPPCNKSAYNDIMAFSLQSLISDVQRWRLKPQYCYQILALIKSAYSDDFLLHGYVHCKKTSLM